MARPKLHTWLKPGSTHYQMVVHAYYHLLQEERFVRLAELGREAEVRPDMVEAFMELAGYHGFNFDRQIEMIPQWHDYLLDRQYANLDRRVRKFLEVATDPDATFMKPAKRDRSTEARRIRKARYN